MLRCEGCHRYYGTSPFYSISHFGGAHGYVIRYAAGTGTEHSVGTGGHSGFYGVLELEVIALSVQLRLHVKHVHTLGREDLDQV
ncbi:MAG: uncharacterized protein KVP18_002444 [Porospora cf. gigantea A]|uniref:uncharacterized protein n=1 Tax=Porospora cf. gigantea A TaxID=2853593 RepID=UPI003559EEE3|nr:MAG: hypothetical protein KVP18_002444 [Porospora cf. gigantea A]